MPKSPMRFLSCAILALTYVWRSFAYLYSAFSERSPCARATAISLGSSTLSSCSSWSISSCSFCLIFAIGLAIAIHQKDSRGRDSPYGRIAPAQGGIIDARELRLQDG